MTTVYCEECSFYGDDSDCNSIHHIYERVEVGGTMPGGACPRCGSLCYPRRYDPWTAEGRWARAEKVLGRSEANIRKLLRTMPKRGAAAERRMLVRWLAQIASALDPTGKRHVATVDGTTARVKPPLPKKAA